MKIGIVTIVDNNNYGNRLQNYAVQQILKKMNVETITLKNDSFSNTKKNYILRKIKNLFYKGSYSQNIQRRENFLKFNKLINFSKNKINAFSKLEDYDFFITGSDQVWNPTFGRMRDVDLLNFTVPEKRISFAASIAVHNIPDEYREYFAESVKNYKSISVREYRGKEIVEELTNRKDIQVLVDPTMLLTADEWSKIAQKPKYLKNDKYILNYFLGELSDKRKNEIERVAKENNCDIINILDKESPFYECGPEEFLYLEKNAFLICTDSFHSCVFSILFNRPFMIFDREQEDVEKMNSRLDTLLKKFDLDKCKFNGKIANDNLKCDYSSAYKILEEERKKSQKFLENALEIYKEV